MLNINEAANDYLARLWLWMDVVESTIKFETEYKNEKTRKD
jgi:hypothetical protein